ncbi:MAG: flagellar protein FliT [Thermus sp.]|uniref:flagellar protein FliT n=1 Tax=Thermus sp. TaxID=275 RepID=UPI003331B315
MIRLNLLPKNLRRRVEPGWWRLVAVLFALAVLGILGVLHFSVQSQLSSLRLERDTLRTEVEALKPFIAEQNRLQAEKKALESLLAIRENLRKNSVPWSEYLSLFIRQIPREGDRFSVALKSVGTKLLSEEEAKRQAEAGAYDGKPVRVEFALQGEALNQAALVRFIRAFETSPRFGISFQGASLDTARGVYTFSATVGLVPQGGEAGVR